MSRPSELALVGLSLLTACAGARTEVIVVTDTDLLVPEDVEVVRFVVTGPTGEVQTATADLSLVAPPVTLGLVHRGGDLGPFVVEASGTLGGAVVVQRTVRFSFVKKMTLMVRADLYGDCVGVACGPGESCGESGCASIDVPEAALAPWPGRAPRLGELPSDGGVIGADTLVDPCSRAEVCNGQDEDCDGRVDEDFDLMGDPAHCGGCNQTCAPMNAVAQCTGGVCGFDSCVGGFADCNGEVSDGCESSLSDPDTCGTCDTVCQVPPHAGRACVAGQCAVGACDAGFGDCDMDAGNGCEQPLDTMAHCGACGAVCDFANTEQACVGGTCQAMGCGDGYADCGGDGACETFLLDTVACGRCGERCVGNRDCVQTDVASFSCTVGCAPSTTPCPGGLCADLMINPEHCGTCDNACPVPFGGVATCLAGACGYSCDAGWGDCNGDPSDGCERPLGTTTDCSACNDACVAPQTCVGSGAGFACTG